VAVHKATLVIRRRRHPKGVAGTHQLDARTMSHDRQANSPSAQSRDRMVMKRAGLFHGCSPNSWVRCPKAGVRAGRTDQPSAATHRGDRRYPRWTTGGSVLHSGPQSERPTLPCQPRSRHSPAAL
jgi:hypothetical protein